MEGIMPLAEYEFFKRENFKYTSVLITDCIIISLDTNGFDMIFRYLGKFIKFKKWW